MEEKYEKVHTETDYYDGPRGGVADFSGSPFVYESEFADLDGKSEDTFLLQSIDNTTLQLAIESYEIWRRWQQAYNKGLVKEETHPALPEDRERNDELESILADKLAIDKSSAIRAKGNFKVVNSEMWVKWELIDRHQK